MNAAKEGAIALIRSLPDDCTIEDIRHHLAVLREADEGFEAIEEGRGGSEEEVEGTVAGFDELPFFGMWSDRDDLPEAVDQVREGRESWRRRPSRTD